MTPAVLVLGGASEIGFAIARAYAAQGHAVHLAARKVARLEPMVADLKLRGAPSATAHEWDVLDYGAIDRLLDVIDPAPGIVVCAVGLLTSPDTDLLFRTNFNGCALALEAVAKRFAAKGDGLIVGISSVAGDRGRSANPLYGPAKAGFTAYLSALRNRLFRRGVRVMTVKPGPVATRMLTKKAPFTCSVDDVARAVLRADAHRRDVIYVGWIWWPIMTAIRLLPEPLFKRLTLG
jgi:NAD(P)-dependent dehydrogenase (short-subunit alcohol dehydrogenase family)